MTGTMKSICVNFPPSKKSDFVRCVARTGAQNFRNPNTKFDADYILWVDGWQYKEAKQGYDSSRVDLDCGMLCLRELLRAIEIDGIQNGELCVNCVAESCF